MANCSKVRIGGTSFDGSDIIEVSFTTSTAYNANTGERTGVPVHGTINIVMKLKKEDSNWEFAQEKTKGKLFDGEITFIEDGAADQEIKKLGWKDGFVVNYGVHVPRSMSEFTTESIMISAREITLGSITSKMNWSK